MNPEFRRYLWLELTLQRLVIMPLVLGMLFFLIIKGDSGDSGGQFALVTFMILVVAWGGKLSADSIVDEVNARTWDNQRMSSLPPWQMVWGKLFGSSIITWYGGLFCLSMYLVGNYGSQPLLSLLVLALAAVLMAISFQAVGIVSALMSMRANLQNRNTLLLILLVLLVGPVLLPQLVGNGQALFKTIQWYGWETPRLHFILFSAVTWCGWALFGAYRMMRSEMQYRNGPFAWLLFLLWGSVYFIGLIDEGIDGRSIAYAKLIMVYSGVAVIAYILLLSEQINLVELRKLIYQRREKDSGFYLDLIPLWLLTLSFLLLLTIAAMAMSVDEQGLAQALLAAPTAFCFIVRDTAVILMLRLSPNSRRGVMPVVIYLVVAYYIASAITGVISNSEFLAALFIPNLSGDWSHGLLPALLGAMVMVAVAGWRLYPLVRKPSS